MEWAAVDMRSRHREVRYNEMKSGCFGLPNVCKYDCDGQRSAEKLNRIVFTYNGLRTIDASNHKFQITLHVLGSKNLSMMAYGPINTTEDRR